MIAYLASLIATLQFDLLPLLASRVIQLATLQFDIDSFIKLLTAVSAIIAAVVAYLSKQQINKAETIREVQTQTLTNVVEQTTQLKDEVKQVAVHTNSMKDELVALTAKSAHAEGMLAAKEKKA